LNPDLPALLEKLSDGLPPGSLVVRGNPSPGGQVSLLVEPEALFDVMARLREEEGYDFLSNVTGVDWPDPALADKVAPPPDGEASAPREVGFLEVVYHLYSTRDRIGPLVVRARTADRGDNAILPSVTPVFRSAEFQEREIYDLFGIVFTGHPDLRRILMWDEFVDHPMRKDYVPPSDHEYEPTPHDGVLELANRHLDGKEGTP
jgi:NADH-quinone oxidoreductase subunit C